MCILFYHVDPNPDKGGYRLILATNRDEYYKRPAQKAHIDKETNVIGGIDMEPGREGGTWLAFKSKDDDKNEGKKHCACILLNLTGTVVKNPVGRGKIITNYLNSTKDFEQYTKFLDKGNYSGFNLVSIELSKDNSCCYHYGNIPRECTSFEDKHTLSFGNSPFSKPLSKVKEGELKFEEVLKKNLKHADLEKALLNLLKDETKFLPDQELQSRSPEAYQYLSSIFIKLDPPGYGTRTHTLIFVDYDWNLKFVEHTMEEPIDVNNPKWVESRIESKL